MSTVTYILTVTKTMLIFKSNSTDFDDDDDVFHDFGHETASTPY